MPQQSPTQSATSSQRNARRTIKGDVGAVTVNEYLLVRQVEELCADPELAAILRALWPPEESLQSGADTPAACALFVELRELDSDWAPPPSG